MARVWAVCIGKSARVHRRKDARAVSKPAGVRRPSRPQFKPRTGSGLFCGCAIPVSPRSRPAPELAPPRPLALPFPSPAARAEHCGTQTKCPQTGWSEPSGNSGGAVPHARGGGSLPTSPSPPLTPLPLPHPDPPGKREPSPRSPNRLPSANRPQRPLARLAGPPRSSPQALGALPSRRLSPPTSQARRCSGPPCPSRRPSTGLGAAARDRVPSASRGRREAASRALRPLPPGRRRRHLAATAWRGGGGGAAGLRALAPPPAGNEEGRGGRGPALFRRARPPRAATVRLPSGRWTVRNRENPIGCSQWYLIL